MSSTDSTGDFPDDSSLESTMSWRAIASNANASLVNVAITTVVANAIFNDTHATPASRSSL